MKSLRKTAFILMALLVIVRRIQCAKPGVDVNSKDEGVKDASGRSGSWLLKYASGGLNDTFGAHFTVEVDKLEQGKNSFSPDNQEAFLFNKNFEAALSFEQATIKFKVVDESGSQIFTARKKKQVESIDRELEEEWEGDISSDRLGSPQINGLLYCSLSSRSLECTIAIDAASSAGFYRIAMTEDSLVITRSGEDENQEIDHDEELRSVSELEPDPLVGPPSHLRASSVATKDELLYGGEESNTGVEQPKTRKLPVDTEHDVLVFYTSAAAAKVGDSATLQNQLVAEIEIVNSWLVLFEATTLHLASTWELRDDDASDWPSWVGTNMNQAVMNSFLSNTALKNRRNTLGADIIVLIHDWSSGNVPGVADASKYALLIDSDHIDANIFWENSVGGVGGEVYTIDDIYASDHKSSSGGLRVAPEIYGNQQDWQERKCTTGIRGIGMYHYRYDSTGMDVYRLRVVCRAKPVYSVGRVPKGHDSVTKLEPITCKDGNLVGGVGLTRYRIGSTTTDYYQISVWCPGEGWKSSPTPEGAEMDSQRRAYWHSPQSSGFEDLTFLKFDRYRLSPGRYETYQLNIAFGHATALKAAGSLFQDEKTLRCMERLSNNNVVMKPCRGNKPQMWYFNSKREIRNQQQKANACLTYNGKTKSVMMKKCNGKDTQKWVYKKASGAWSPKSTNLCLHVTSNNNAKLIKCSSSARQKFIFDTKHFAGNSNGPI